MNPYDEYSAMNATSSTEAAETPESVGRVLRLAHELHKTKEQLRMMRNAMRAAKLMPTEMELARVAFDLTVENSLFDKDCMHLVAILPEPAVAYRAPAIVMELSFSCRALGQFCSPGGIFVEEFARSFANFRQSLYENYALAGGDTDLAVRLVRCEFTTSDPESLARWEAHVLKDEVPAAPHASSKAKSL